MTGGSGGGSSGGSPGNGGGVSTGGGTAGAGGGAAGTGGGAIGTSGGTTGTGGGTSGSAGGGTSGTAGGTNGTGGSPMNPDPPNTWVNVTGNLAGLPSECGNLSLLSAQPGRDFVIAGVALKGLWASTTAGGTWTHLGDGAGSGVITNRPSSIVYDPSTPDRFWASGIYNGPGVYVTTDHGRTFNAGWLGHNDSVGVDLTDPQRGTLLVGGHEQSQKLWRSTNGGTSFTEIGSSFPSGTKFSSQVLVLDSQTFLVGCQGYAMGTPGIYRSSNAGMSWTRVSALGGQSVPLVASDGSLYWAGDGLQRSVDRGQNWQQVTNQLNSNAPVELPDGRIASFRGRQLVISADHGSTWTNVGPPVGADVQFFVYSVPRRMFLVSHGDCGNLVLPRAIERLFFDYSAP